MCSKNQGEIDTDFVVLLDKAEFEGREEGAETVETALNHTAKVGRVGRLKIDPQSFKIGELTFLR